MAKNLRAKLPKEDTLVINDVNTDATTRFVEEVGIATSSVGPANRDLGIYVAKSPREVADKSVSFSSFSIPVALFWSIPYDEYVLSMI
jgi:3-hydroxyisobutyrate/3-hydroxypropionate dehydrogenase